MTMNWVALLLGITIFHYGACITTPTKKVNWASARPRTYDRCSSRIETRLEAIKRRDSPSGRDASLDLSGYALHQKLRTVAYDMYVTGMKVRVPRKSGWFRVEQCQYAPQEKTLGMRLVFRDLAVSGQVMLYEEYGISRNPGEPAPVDTCRMTLRLRRAGLELSVKPQKTTRGFVDIATETQFVEPNFVSVYTYGCTSPRIEHRQGLDEDEDLRGPEATGSGEEDLLEPGVRIANQPSELGEEMETVFLKGVKTLLTTYMQKQLEPALRDTLLSNLGYTISYG